MIRTLLGWTAVLSLLMLVVSPAFLAVYVYGLIVGLLVAYGVVENI